MIQMLPPPLLNYTLPSASHQASEGQGYRGMSMRVHPLLHLVWPKRCIASHCDVWQRLHRRWSPNASQIAMRYRLNYALSLLPHRWIECRRRGGCGSYLERIPKHSWMSFFITFGMIPDWVDQMLAGMIIIVFPGRLPSKWHYLLCLQSLQRVASRHIPPSSTAMPASGKYHGFSMAPAFSFSVSSFHSFFCSFFVLFSPSLLILYGPGDRIDPE